MYQTYCLYFYPVFLKLLQNRVFALHILMSNTSVICQSHMLTHHGLKIVADLLKYNVTEGFVWNCVSFFAYLCKLINKIHSSFAVLHVVSSSNALQIIKKDTRRIILTGCRILLYFNIQSTRILWKKNQCNTHWENQKGIRCQ